MTKPVLEITNLTKTFSNKHILFSSFNLTLKARKVAIFGPNGCGKTTLLRIISALDDNYSGNIYFKNFLKNNTINISYAFQDPSNFLFPWMNSLENILFPLKIANKYTDNSIKKVKELLKEYNLNISFKSYPYQLSIGQRQIVVFLRSIINSPDLLLLDEPFSNLDYLNRTKILFHLAKDDSNVAKIILVSHTIEDAIIFADELILLGGSPTNVIGRIQIPFKAKERTSELFKSNKFNSIKWSALKTLKEYLK